MLFGREGWGNSTIFTNREFSKMASFHCITKQIFFHSVTTVNSQRFADLAFRAEPFAWLLSRRFAVATRQTGRRLGQLLASVPPSQEVQRQEGLEDDGQVPGHALRQSPLVHGPRPIDQWTYARIGETRFNEKQFNVFFMKCFKQEIVRFVLITKAIFARIGETP
jgi:hypothetical protein